MPYDFTDFNTALNASFKEGRGFDLDRDVRTLKIQASKALAEAEDKELADTFSHAIETVIKDGKYLAFIALLEAIAGMKYPSKRQKMVDALNDRLTESCVKLKLNEPGGITYSFKEDITVPKFLTDGLNVDSSSYDSQYNRILFEFMGVLDKCKQQDPHLSFKEISSRITKGAEGLRMSPHSTIQERCMAAYEKGTLLALEKLQIYDMSDPSVDFAALTEIAKQSGVGNDLNDLVLQAAKKAGLECSKELLKLIADKTPPLPEKDDGKAK